MHSLLQPLIKYRCGASILAIASLLFVILALPVHADEIVYFEDFEDGVFDNCTNLNGDITTGSAYSGSKKFSDTNIGGDCNSNFIASSTGIFTYTVYIKKEGTSNADIVIEGGESPSSSGIYIRMASNSGSANPADDGKILVCANAGCTGTNARAELGSWGSGWHKVQIVQNGDSIVSKLDDSGSWLPITALSSQTGIRLNFNGNNRIQIDDFSIYAGDPTENQITDNSTICGYGLDDDVCILSITPAPGSVIATTTNGMAVNMTYTTGIEDHCYILCTSYVRVGIIDRTDPTRTKAIYAEEIPAAGEQTYYHFFSNVDSAGTYSVEVDFYNIYAFNSLQTDKLFYTYLFYNGKVSTQSELNAANDAYRENNYVNVDAIEEGSADIGNPDDPGVIVRLFRDAYLDFLHLPPWGYIVVFNDTFNNATSTAIADLTIEFPTSSPAYGQSLVLPLTSSASNTSAYISAAGTTVDGLDSWEQIMKYWTLFWYLVFALWVVREIFGVWNFGSTDTNTLNLSKSKVVGNQRVDNRGSTLDLRK